jgi:hypothetical protein
MKAVNLLSATVAIFLSTAALLLLKPCCEKPQQFPNSLSAPFHVQRATTVQEHYDNYSKRLQAYYEALSSVLESSAPELLSLLEPPNELQPGYQVLPKIVAEAAPVTHQFRAQSAQYSWPWTDHLIGKAVSEIGGSNDELKRALDLKPTPRRSVYRRLARGYRRIREQQQNINAHIQYNRLWQAAIAANRSIYDRDTVLHDQVLKRQAVLEVFDARRAAALKSPYKTMKRVFVASLDELSAGLRERDGLLAREIEAATEFFNMPLYVRVKQQNAHVWIVHVPIYTDIEESEFVRSVEEAIEKTWHLRSGEDEYRIKLEFSYISTTDLYRTHLPAQNRNRMDIQEHVGLFPADGAILTTGAVTTHVDGRAIILGPYDITPRILAHEFGHILGFKDGYFRGYKDLGEDGFKIMEVVADPDDIMGAPATGPVLRRHFERIIKSFRELQTQNPSDIL